MAWYYGSDGSTSGFPSCTSAEPNFYIGKIGGGITDGSGGVFNTTTANAAGGPQTFAYWDLMGPAANDTSDTMTQWGTAQAHKFVEAWQAGSYASYLGGTTFFLDIEYGTNGGQGWGTETESSGTLTDRQQILLGALDYLSNVSNVINESGSAGVYIGPAIWTNLFEDYTSPYPFVFWYAGTYLTSPDCTQGTDGFYDLAVVDWWVEDDDLAVCIHHHCRL